jgi:2-keto-4-pentenoate hydratase/2-oxohepta-3-ene-1,7-dioic acid hydratase in catechol pathway
MFDTNAVGRSASGNLRGSEIHPVDGAFADFQLANEVPVWLADVKLLAPTKIIAVGPNYKAYFPNGGAPKQPSLWTKPASCLNHPEGIIELPPGGPPTTRQSWRS